MDPFQQLYCAAGETTLSWRCTSCVNGWRVGKALPVVFTMSVVASKLGHARLIQASQHTKPINTLFLIEALFSFSSSLEAKLCLA